ncbi:hypothetical protein F949_01632 [Acinetobacter junii NIPH 182]|uniref:hypothetical protein n=1 Tax=Acinetobacter junii TaxID=40215 RepID=UPI0002D09ABE|nr:hypothetical protein [Acinetobacter junii]ENV64243.1 hypothetical protein F949_01632 [Acinetobacter junii NIPH 182]
MKYDIKSCEYISLAGTVEAQLFDSFADYTQKMLSHSEHLKTPRLDKLSDQQEREFKDFIYQLCGVCFASHQLYAVTPDCVETLKKGADSYFSINKIQEQLGFLPHNEILLKSLAEEAIKFSENNVIYNLYDPKKKFYLYFKGGRIEGENSLILTIIVDELVQPRKKFLGIF